MSYNSLRLPTGGGEVTYCYEVINTSLGTFELHDLVDDELGELLSDESHTLALVVRLSTLTLMATSQSDPTQVMALEVEVVVEGGSFFLHLPLITRSLR
jgi:hypothetical protein